MSRDRFDLGAFERRAARRRRPRTALLGGEYSVWLWRWTKVFGACGIVWIWVGGSSGDLPARAFAEFSALRRYYGAMPRPRLVPLDEAAEATGLGRRTLQSWLHDGRLTGYRIAGDRRRYLDLGELDRLRRPQRLPKQHGRKA